MLLLGDISLRAAANHQQAFSQVVLEIALLLVHSEDALQSVCLAKRPESIVVLIFQLTHVRSKI